MRRLCRRDLERIAPRWSDGVITALRPGRNPFTENNLQKSVIFIHVPKNAGRSICTAVLNESGRHIPLRRYYAYDAKAANAFFKFAVVRDPVDRFVSAFNGLKGSAQGGDEYSRFVRRHIDPFESVEEFGSWMAGTRANTAKVLGWLHFWPQWKWVSVGGSVKLDEVLHFESLAANWPIFADRHGFPKDLPLIGQGNKPRYTVDPPLDAFLRRVYQVDSEVFGYQA